MPSSSSSTLTDLCLACSGIPESLVFRTQCCARPICASCRRANPRLVRYVPCLACLPGVRAGAGPGKTLGREEENLDGALRDADVFAIADDSEDEGEEEHTPSPPPAYRELESAAADLATSTAPATESSELPSDDATPRKHYIRRNDTLRGLALQYGVDGRALCRLNNLPPSTLSTTPHLLHTRTVLLLPPSSSTSTSPQTADEHTREREIGLERTAKHLQLITKEADWRVARAYAVLAQSQSGSGASSYPTNDSEKGKSANTTRSRTADERAVDAYLEDDAWEADERAAGRGPQPGPGPSSSSSSSARRF